MMEERTDVASEFPKRLWKRPIELYESRARPRIAAANLVRTITHLVFENENRLLAEVQENGASPHGGSSSDSEVKVSTEAGNARIIVELPSADRKDLSLHCTEDSVTLSAKTEAGSWTKEIALPFRVDPDTAKAVFRNKKLELVVRRHGSFNPPRPRIDWV
jgi:HSP20 family molecular chaperone IbpA